VISRTAAAGCGSTRRGGGGGAIYRVMRREGELRNNGDGFAIVNGRRTPRFKTRCQHRQSAATRRRSGIQRRRACMTFREGERIAPIAPALQPRQHRPASASRAHAHDDRTTFSAAKTTHRLQRRRRHQMDSRPAQDQLITKRRAGGRSGAMVNPPTAHGELNRRYLGM